MTGAGRGVLAGQHAVVTGGSRGIGAAIATALAADGAAVTIIGRSAEDLDSHLAALRGRFGDAVRAVRGDVGNAADIDRAFADAARAPGPVTILINNAGYADARPFEEITPASWERTLAINLTAAFLSIQQVLPSMLAGGGGRIVNIASTAGLKGYSRSAAYCAAKHGLVGLSRALAVETARTGITVNAVCPGYTEGTGMLNDAIANIMRATGRSADDARAVLVRQSPRGSLVTAEEIAAKVSWLCSPEASSITGQTIVVAGGEVM
ncbi:MAG TPA: SDR family NAD(P)-dependent oxidoreductase [Vicinamibacterales bacterium]|nr:SDR family NAD(P)-dependent oxidoreductase [Vicinamibacterales bacterium]